MNHKPRHIGFLVFPEFDLMDLSGPLEVFHWAEQLAPGSYKFSVMSMSGGDTAASCGLQVHTEKAITEPLDTLIVVGGGLAHATLAPELVAYTRVAANSARRTSSICTGAFLMAATGLLDGIEATTHWRFADRLQSLYPEIKVNGDRMFVKSGKIWTAGGISAGIDVSLALVEEDLGLEISQAVANIIVVPRARPHGQMQFSAPLPLS